MTPRDAAPSDVAWMAALAAEAYRDVFAPLLPDCDWSGFDAAHFTARFAAEWPRIRVIEGLGFCLQNGAHIAMFFVAGKARGKGVGARLLDDAVGRGARTLECFALNQGARRFYERHGWRLIDASSRPFAGRSCDFVSYAWQGPVTASA